MEIRAFFIISSSDNSDTTKSFGIAGFIPLSETVIILNLFLGVSLGHLFISGIS